MVHQGGGGENYSTTYETRDGLLSLPSSHGANTDHDGAPLGTGTALLLGLGAAYLVTKNRKNHKNPNSKFFLIAAIIMAGMISAQPMKVWATAYRAYTGGTQQASTTISSSNVSSGSVGVISWTGNNCTYSSSRVNIAANGYITFTAQSGYNITKIVIVSGSSSSYYGTWSTTAGSVSSSSGTTTVDNINASSVKVTTSTAFRCTEASHITIHYTAVTTYTVTYNVGEGGSGTAPTDGPYAQGVTVTVKDRGGISHETLGFRGWSDGTTTYHPGETFTMGTSNVTLTAIWTDKCSFGYNGNENTGGAVPSGEGYYSSYGTGARVKVLGNTGSLVKTDKAWDGWTKAQDGSGTTYKADDTFIITENTTLYAKWIDIPTYTLVTSTSQITPGAHYVIASSKSAGSANAMDEQNGKIRDIKSTTITVQDKDGDSKDDIYIEDAGLYEFVISGYENNYTIYDETNETPGYLYHNGDKDVKVKTSIDNSAKWKITFSSDAVVITNVDATSYSLQYNSGSPRYTTYSSNQTKPFLYKKDNEKTYSIYSPTTIATVTIATDEVYTVESGQTLTVSTSLTNNGTAANLVIEDGGQLITSNKVNATLQKEITKYSEATGAGNTDGWYLIASPVDAYATSNIALATADLYSYDEASHFWWNAQGTGEGNHAFTFLNRGKGYLYANSANQTLPFAGEMEATDKEITMNLSYNGSENISGINLVGNPFTRNLTGADIKLNGTNITSYYAVENGTEITSRAIADYPIKPGRGFIVQATAADQQLVFNPSAKGNRNDAEVKSGYIRIEAGNDNFMDRAYVQIGEGNTLRKMTINDNVAHVYVMQDGKDYAAATIEEARGEMPVNFVAAEDGQYTITVNAEDVEMGYLHLIDNITGADIDLLANPSYTFNGSNMDYASRFRLVFSANNANEENGTDNFAFISNGQIILNDTYENATMQVVDMLGRIVSTEQVNGNNAQMAPVANGVYVLRLTNNGETKTQKIVVK